MHTLWSTIHQNEVHSSNNEATHFVKGKTEPRRTCVLLWCLRARNNFFLQRISRRGYKRFFGYYLAYWCVSGFNLLWSERQLQRIQCNIEWPVRSGVVRCVVNTGKQCLRFATNSIDELRARAAQNFAEGLIAVHDNSQKSRQSTWKYPGVVARKPTAHRNIFSTEKHFSSCTLLRVVDGIEEYCRTKGPNLRNVD